MAEVGRFRSWVLVGMLVGCSPIEGVEDIVCAEGCPGAGGATVGVGGAGASTGGAIASGGLAGIGGVVASGGGLVASGGTATGGAAGPTEGRQHGDICYALCVSAESDPDGDGWGWENEASCVVVGSAPETSGGPCSLGGDASGGASSGGTGGGGGSVDCGHAPIDPDATVAARKLLCYLYEIQGQRVLSGQQETSWNNPEGDMTWYRDHFGDFPAVLGGDYLYPNGTSSRAIAYFNAGGIVMLRYHMGAPPGADTYENSLGSTNIQNVLTSGTNEYNSFYAKLAYIGDELQELEDAGVAVLWAPFHEVQPNGWFWWSKGSAQQFIQMWRNMQDYLMNTRGLHNLVWLLPWSSSPDGNWSPGKQYYDLAGPDTYANNPPFTGLFATTRNIVGAGHPIPLHETGRIPQPSQMFPTAAPWVLFSVWAGYQISHNNYSDVESTYASEYTLTRGELPNLR